MVTHSLNRRSLLTALAASGLSPQLAFGKDYVDLDWNDLLPIGQTVIPPELLALTDHDTTLPSSQQPESNGVRSDWDGQTVRLPGFVVPLDHSGSGVTAFILVPFVGACVHVPPPPANQLVFVTTSRPFESKGLYEPVNVVGKLNVSALSTQLAEIAYALTADEVLPYEV